MERKLASVRRIAAIDPIPDADNIVCATVDGWKLVTQKSNNFKAGDLVVYFEIDSFLPVCEKFEFLRKSSFKTMGNVEGFRLRTIRLKKQISQGLILPMSEFFTWDEDEGMWEDEIQIEDLTEITDVEQTESGVAFNLQVARVFVEEGDDLTERLGVVKWDPPLAGNLAGKARGNFPPYIQKTDQERVQNIFRYLHKYADDDYEVTMKLDGSSMTAYVKDGYVGVCSRNLDLTETEDNAFWKVARSSGLVEALESYWKETGKNIAVQGELMGPGVQGNRENLKELELYVFDIFDIDNFAYMNVPDRLDTQMALMSTHGANVKSTPFLGYRRLSDFPTVEHYLAFAEGPSINHPIAEGIVFKSVEGERHSFKVISNAFLLKEKD